MEKNVLATRIKELRISKGYSQEYLAEVAQLSLRTIQRIENAETEPRGDTLNRLAKALGVNISELTDRPSTDQSNSYLALMNLSALTFLVIIKFPLLCFICPLIMWLYKRNEYKDVYERGKQILNFQITWCIIVTLYFIFLVFHMFPGASYVMPNRSIFGLGHPEAILIGIFIIIGFNIVMIMVNTILVLTGNKMKYWPAYRFFK